MLHIRIEAIDSHSVLQPKWLSQLARGLLRFRAPSAKFAKYHCSTGSSSLEVPVCRSVSHYNWFARYEVNNEKGKR